MTSNISFFNWSLKKILAGETDSLLKARYKIVFIIFILSFLKASVAIITAAYFGQELQLVRAIIYLLIYLSLFKLFLGRVLSFRIIAHIILFGSFVLVCTNLYITSLAVNIATLQFVFVLILASFYTLNSRVGLIYSCLGITPIILSLIIKHEFGLSPGVGSLQSPGYELIILLNFITIIYIPHLFYQAFAKTLNEKEKLNIELQNAVQLANEAVKSKAEFLSTMSHELRTPLNTVIGTTDILLSERYEPHQIENLKDLKFSANCLYHIINDILDFNKLEASKLSLEAINVDLGALIPKVCSALYHQSNKKHIGLELEIDKEIHLYEVVTDPTRITQVIYNLVGNAIKFTSVGEVRVKLNILKKERDHLIIRFAVSDTGIGIRKEKQASIFEPFKQASGSTTRNFGGTGLGLSIVKRLLLLFDSSIKLESTEHQGSTFYFDINFKYHQKSETKAAELPNENLQDQDLSDLNILVAEDNLMNRLLIKKVLARWNNNPVFAENGQEAIDLAAKTTFHVILMDLHMPLVDGYLAAKTIKYGENNINHNAQIVAFTASISDSILEEVKVSGMIDYIYKPFNAKLMYQKIRDLYPLES